MYSSVSEAEYQMKKARAEEEARKAYNKSGAVLSQGPSVPSGNLPGAEPVSSRALSQPSSQGWLRGILSRIQEDDILLLALLFLMFNDSKDDDPLILIIIAALLLN